MHAIQPCCFYFEEEPFVVYVWTHVCAYILVRAGDTFILKHLEVVSAG